MLPPCARARGEWLGPGRSRLWRMAAGSTYVEAVQQVAAQSRDWWELPIARGQLDRLEYKHVQVWNVVQRGFDPRQYVAPVQTAKARSQWRNGNRPNAPIPYFVCQRQQAALNVLNEALVLPVPLGWEVDDVARREPAGFRNEHLAGADKAGIASGFVGFEVCWVRLLELQGETPTHYPDTVHWIDDGLGIRSEDVSSHHFDLSHGVLWSMGGTAHAGPNCMISRTELKRSGFTALQQPIDTTWVDLGLFYRRNGGKPPNNTAWEAAALPLSYTRKYVV